MSLTILRDIIRRGLLALDDDNGVDESTYTMLYDLIKVAWSQSEADTFSMAVNATDGRYYFSGGNTSSTFALEYLER